MSRNAQTWNSNVLYYIMKNLFGIKISILKTRYLFIFENYDVTYKLRIAQSKRVYLFVYHTTVVAWFSLRPLFHQQLYVTKLCGIPIPRTSRRTQTKSRSPPQSNGIKSRNWTGNTVKYDCALLLVDSNIHLSSQNIRLECRRNDVNVGESTHAV